ncbi:ribosomal protein L28 [Corynebacterium matruchotii ATCC 14266]|uniref:Large ribosomal subunit protein bL28 n=2 Tax=Corynebacterium matruchotii TaxID=43768 RepID=E0DIV5_9CORY|nr:ribosomal protein L28 [Corynebacterium matruchotii ATCC 14266]
MIAHCCCRKCSFTPRSSLHSCRLNVGRLGESLSMSAICQVTGRKPGYGKSVSHSHRRTSRRWNPNVQRRKFYLPSEGRTITLTVSTKGLKVIDRDGIESVVAKIRARGEKV